MKKQLIKIEIPLYSEEQGFKIDWESNFKIFFNQSGDQLMLKANKEGLRSLAKILLLLSQDKIPLNYHVHLDDTNAFEENSVDLIIEKI
jgi:hypothetical protein